MPAGMAGLNSRSACGTPPSIEAFVHILLIHQAFAALDEPGGTRHHELARHLVQRGHRVTIIASPVSYLTGKTRAGRSRWVERRRMARRSPSCAAYTYPALHRSFVHRILSFLSFMVSSFLIGLGVRTVDLVWGTSPPIFQGITAWLLSRLKRAPFLFEVRDLWPAFAVAVRVLQQPLLIRLSEWLERFLYRRAKVVVVNSPGYIEHVRQRGARRVELVPNGAETGMFDPLADGLAFRRQHGLEGKFIALYAGAHGMSNDLGVVLQAATAAARPARDRLRPAGGWQRKAEADRPGAGNGAEQRALPAAGIQDQHAHRPGCRRRVPGNPQADRAVQDHLPQQGVRLPGCRAPGGAGDRWRHPPGDRSG